MSSRKQFAQSIRDLLKQSTVRKMESCEHCDASMQHVTAMFELDGETWETPLPFCPYCTPSLPPKSHAA
jgi:hypothetical protein